MKQNFKWIISLSIIMAIIFMSLLAPLIAPYPPNQIDMKNKLQGMTSMHLLGTDALGRDVLSRMIYGGRASLLLALEAVFFSMVLGLIMGMVGGYYGGGIDVLITTVANIFQGIPSVSFMIAIAGILGPGIKPLLIGLLIISWAGFSRMVRSEVLKIKAEPYIEAMKCLGANDFQIMYRHIFPNMMSNVIVIFTTRVGRSLLTIASLSYLGLGITPPHADWSVMINDARMTFRSSPHLILIPGIFIFLLIWSLNMLGDALRDRFDVKHKEIWK